jgi:hypothetical protein
MRAISTHSKHLSTSHVIQLILVRIPFQALLGCKYVTARYAYIVRTYCRVVTYFQNNDARMAPNDIFLPRKERVQKKIVITNFRGRSKANSRLSRTGQASMRKILIFIFRMPWNCIDDLRERQLARVTLSTMCFVSVPPRNQSDNPSASKSPSAYSPLALCHLRENSQNPASQASMPQH